MVGVLLLVSCYLIKTVIGSHKMILGNIMTLYVTQMENLSIFIITIVVIVITNNIYTHYIYYS